MDLYKTYLVVGGMPVAVKEYIDKKDFDFVLVTQKSINDSYVADMAKYATPHETTRIMATFNSIPAQLAKENKKFQYKVIKSAEHVMAKSLQQYIKKYQPKYAIRVSGKNFGFENGIKSIPLYATFLI